MISKLSFATAMLAVAPALGDNKYGMNVYWGQKGPDTDRLSSYCTSDSIDSITLAFVNNSPEHGNGLPGTNFAAHCASEVFAGDNGKDSKLLSACGLIKEDIKFCQNQGKKIYISIGGVYSAQYSNYEISDVPHGIEFADKMFDAFGPKRQGYNGPRPFDSDISVSVDGFDFDIEQKFDNMNPYIAMVQQLRTRIQQSSKKDMVITAAPECPQGNWFTMEKILRAAKFDKVFVQFYNNALNCDAAGSLFNYDDWETFFKSTSYRPQLFVGLPGSPDSASTGYIRPVVAMELINKLKKKDMFSGLMLWDAYTAKTNVAPNGKNYYDNMNDYLGRVPQPKPTTSSSTSSVASSTSIKTSSTSSSAVSTASSVVSTTSSSIASSSTSSSISSYVFSTTSSVATSSTPSSSSSTIAVSSYSVSSISSSTTSSAQTSSSASSSTATTSSAVSTSSVQTSSAPTSSYPVSSIESTSSTISSSSAATTSSAATRSSVQTSSATSGAVSTSSVATFTSYSMSSIATTSSAATTSSVASSSSVQTSASSSTSSSATTSTVASTSSIATFTSYSMSSLTSSYASASISSTGSTSSNLITSSSQSTVSASTSSVTTTSSSASSSTSTATTYGQNSSSSSVQSATSSSAPVASVTASSSTQSAPLSTASSSYSIKTASSTYIWSNNTVPYPGGYLTVPNTYSPTVTGYTTSTVYSTKTYTTDGNTVTETVPVYTTICPVTASSSATTSANKPAYSTSTVYSTAIYTISKCAATVIDCPYGSHTTEIVAVGTTVYPANEGYPTTTTTSEEAEEYPVETPSGYTAKAETTEYITATVYPTASGVESASSYTLPVIYPTANYPVYNPAGKPSGANNNTAASHTMSTSVSTVMVYPTQATSSPSNYHVIPTAGAGRVAGFSLGGVLLAFALIL